MALHPSGANLASTNTWIFLTTDASLMDEMDDVNQMDQATACIRPCLSCSQGACRVSHGPSRRNAHYTGMWLLVGPPVVIAIFPTFFSNCWRAALSSNLKEQQNPCCRLAFVWNHALEHNHLTLFMFCFFVFSLAHVILYMAGPEGSCGCPRYTKVQCALRVARPHMHLISKRAETPFLLPFARAVLFSSFFSWSGEDNAHHTPLVPVM